MANFRFPPQRLTGTFFATLATALVVLGAPWILSAALPYSEPEPEQVMLSVPGYDWDIPVPGLYCTPNYESMLPLAWDCGETMVQATITEDVDDDELALRRAIRSNSFTGMPTGPVQHEGEVLVLDDAPSQTRALSIPGEENLDYQIIITGENAQALSQRFLEAV
ncbi:hypothetical protein [Corynebacterium sp.]|uniref:hypothetical protein n=1 Tax=Corynebacterium sp. TaxID=1720 RepID=UPI0026DC5A83|nr:hypothetical protein [Corynebacterium sp.]MDO5032582.1 hypothetical protein [Corynebacterium sp.]